MLTFLPEWRGLPPEEVAEHALPVVGDTNHPDHRGKMRRFPYPDVSLRPVTDEFDWVSNDEERKLFYWWCDHEDVWTLFYSPLTFRHCLNLSESFTETWIKVKAEIFPSQANHRLHLKHGNPSAYTSGGCRGPLCVVGIRQAMRQHKEITVDVDPEGEEASLEQVAKSFQFYLNWIRVLRNYRTLGDSHQRTDPLRWSAVDRRKTMLLDACDL